MAEAGMKARRRQRHIGPSERCRTDRRQLMRRRMAGPHKIVAMTIKAVRRIMGLLLFYYRSITVQTNPSSRLLPVISGGFEIFIISRSVGAASAREPKVSAASESWLMNFLPLNSSPIR